MTNREIINEAVQDFQDSVVMIKEHYDEFEDKYRVHMGKSLEHFEIAIKALRKQIPKKPHKNYENLSDVWCECGAYIGKPSTERDATRFCKCCGQAIDWSEE